MSDLQDPAHKLLTDHGPSTAKGGPDGPAPSEPAASSAHLLGIPDTLPPTWCAKCEAEVTPKGKGNCPRCGRMLKGSFAARRHPVNRLRRQQLLDTFLREYQPTSQRERSMCEAFAGIVEQLEAIKPGSAEHQRLVQMSQSLGAALDESRTMRASTTFDAYEDFTLDELIERQEALLAASLKLRDEHRVVDVRAAALADERARSARDAEGSALLEPGDAGYEEQQALLTAHEPTAPPSASGHELHAEDPRALGIDTTEKETGEREPTP